jgi:imidazolonepropionase
MANLTIIPNGALLIRNGIIQEAGASRRIENLIRARNADEIDATGRIVMPAFIDPDVALLRLDPSDPAAPPDSARAIRLMSRKRVVGRVGVAAAELARYGVVSVGAHTAAISDLRNVTKLLRAHQVLRLKPIRIRSIFAPRFPASMAEEPAAALDTLETKWLPALLRKKLCSVVELALDATEWPFDFATLHSAGVAVSTIGFALRLRSAHAPTPQNLGFAFNAGALGVIGPIEPDPRAFAQRLVSISCVRVVPSSEAFDEPARAARAIRTAVDEGAAIALSSSYRASGFSCLNPQHLLHLAVDRLGLSTEEAIVATTWNAACTLRLSQVAGSLEPGKSADLLVMDVPDYRELPRRAGHHDVNVVMRMGQLLARGPALSVD